MHIAYQNVHPREYIISFHCIIFIWAHLDAWIIVARVLHNVICCLLTERAHLSFLPCLMCASYEVDVYMYCDTSCHLRGCMTCIFVINVVTSTSMQTRLRVNSVFSSYSAVKLLPCKHVATDKSMHDLRYFSKGVLKTWFCSIHPWSWLQLWSSLACLFRALLLLQNVSWQIVYMLFNLAKVAIVDPCMLWTCSCLG